MQDSGLVMEVVFEQADARACLGFEGYGKLDPSDSGVRRRKVRGDVVAWPPFQLLGPLSQWLPMLVRHNVFFMLLVFA